MHPLREFGSAHLLNDLSALFVQIFVWFLFDPLLDDDAQKLFLSGAKQKVPRLA